MDSLTNFYTTLTLWQSGLLLVTCNAGCIMTDGHAVSMQSMPLVILLGWLYLPVYMSAGVGSTGSASPVYMSAKEGSIISV